MRDRGFDRRKRAAHHDRGGDHHTGGDRLVDDEIGADAEHGGLQERPDEFGDGRKRAEAVGRLAGIGERRGMLFLPAAAQIAKHPERPDDIGIAQRRVGEAMRLHGFGRRPLPGRARREFGQERHAEEYGGADAGRNAEHGMEQENDAEEQRHPRRVEKCEQAGAGQEAAHGLEVADRLAAAAPARRDPVLDQGCKEIVGDVLVEPCAEPDENASTDQFEQRADRQQPDGERAQHV